MKNTCEGVLSAGLVTPVSRSTRYHIVVMEGTKDGDFSKTMHSWSCTPFPSKVKQMKMHHNVLFYSTFERMGWIFP